MAAANPLNLVENLSKNIGHVPAAIRAQTYMATLDAGQAYRVQLAISLLQATPGPEVIELVFTKSYSHTYSNQPAQLDLNNVSDVKRSDKSNKEK